MDFPTGSRLEPNQARPAAWSQAPAGRLARVRGLMTDIDDTLTHQGRIEPQALAALQALHQAGLPTVAITGRPLGWCRERTAGWPLAAVVAENGAVALLPQPQGEPRVEFAQDADTRARHACRLAEVLQRIQREVPRARPASDSAGRVTDIAIDHAEDHHLPPAAIDAVVALMRSEGLTATVSSIHVNGWFGDHSKWTGACWMVQRLWQRALPDELDQWLYVGDSANDQPMFQRFPLSVGVANLMECAATLQHWPRWITAAPRGRGVAEVVQRWLDSRAGATA